MEGEPPFGGRTFEDLTRNVLSLSYRPPSARPPEVLAYPVTLGTGSPTGRPPPAPNPNPNPNPT